jgi:selenoprotein W-related protein
LAAEIEGKLGERAELIQSSGGVFEVQYNGQLVFSKKALHRFPEDAEVISIVKQVDAGVPLDQAQKEAGKNARPAPSFIQWLTSRLGGA